MSRRKAHYVVASVAGGYQIYVNYWRYEYSPYTAFGPLWGTIDHANPTVLALNMREDELAKRRREDARRRKAAGS